MGLSYRISLRFLSRFQVFVILSMNIRNFTNNFESILVMLTLVCIVACSISQLGSRLARTPPSCDSKHRDAWRLFVTTFLFTPVSLQCSVQCSVAANRSQSSLSCLNFKTKVLGPGRKMGGCVSQKLQAAPHGEVARILIFTLRTFAGHFTAWLTLLTLVAYLSSIVRRSFQHWVYLNVCRRTGAVKQRLILPGLFKLIPSPRIP